MLETFKQFVDDPQAFEMFITGQAGTGKTTSLAQLIEHCNENDIRHLTSAFTHKACNILRSKLPEGTTVSTLHSFLKKRPSINDNATKKEHVNVSRQHGTPEDIPQVMFIDEFSMVGEKDYIDIGLAQDPAGEGVPTMKVVYIGDLNQLPPVNDVQAVLPHEPYNVELKEIFRQSKDNSLLDPLCQLVSFLNGASPVPLIEGDNFIRNVSIVQEYIKCKEDKVILAYTNQRVEELNKIIKGREEVCEGDEVFSPTMREHYTYVTWCNNADVDSINLPYGERLAFRSKYKTLEHLLTIHKDFAFLSNEEEEEDVYAIEFGHYQYKLRIDELAMEAALANDMIEQQHGVSGAEFARSFPKDKLSRARAKAWRDYLCYKECVICIDFPFAMTVHKSQGSTYNTVLVDTVNLGQCAENDYKTYLKLLYVAISRASNKVYTN